MKKKLGNFYINYGMCGKKFGYRGLGINLHTTKGGIGLHIELWWFEVMIGVDKWWK